MDRIEFTTNQQRHFSAGGKGGGYRRIPLNCDEEGTHPRVIAFGFGIGPKDVHQVRAHYFPVSGDHCRDIAWELEQERLQREAEEAQRIAEE